MRFRHAVFGYLLFVVPMAAATGSLLLTNAHVYTASDAQPRVEAVLVHDDRIAFVGADTEARRQAQAQTRVIDLAGATLLPGLVDAHAHLAGIGFRELNFNLEGTKSLADLQARLKQRVAEERGT